MKAERLSLDESVDETCVILKGTLNLPIDTNDANWAYRKASGGSGSVYFLLDVCIWMTSKGSGKVFEIPCNKV